MPGMRTGILIYCILTVISLCVSVATSNDATIDIKTSLKLKQSIMEQNSAPQKKSLRSGENIVKSSIYLNDEFYSDEFYSDDGFYGPTADPTLQPSVALTSAPSMPTPVPSRLPTASPSCVPTSPTISPSTRFPTFGGTPPPSAQAGYVLYFDQFLTFSGVQVSTFSDDSRLAITNSVASLMTVNDDAVVYNNDTYEILSAAARSTSVLKTLSKHYPTESTGDINSGEFAPLSHKAQHKIVDLTVGKSFTAFFNLALAQSPFSRVLASADRYSVTCELSITVIQVLYPEFQSTPGALYLDLVGQLEESVASGAFYDKVAEQANFLGSDELANITVADLTSGPFTVLNYTEPATDDDVRKRRLPWWQRFLRNNWLWIMLISMGWSCLMFCIFRICCAKKKDDDDDDDDDDETYYTDDDHSSVASSGYSVVSGSSVSGSNVSRGRGEGRARPSPAAVQALRQSSNRNAYDDRDYDDNDTSTVSDSRGDGRRRGGGGGRNRSRDSYENDSYRRRGENGGGGGGGGRRSVRYAEEDDLPRPASGARRGRRGEARGGSSERRGHRRNGSADSNYSAGSYTRYQMTIGIFDPV